MQFLIFCKYNLFYLFIIFLPRIWCYHLGISSKHLRIVGGAATLKGEIPYIVSLTRRGGHVCGASIINENWLITAAHCVCNGLNKFLKAHQIQGVIGLHNISAWKNEEIPPANSRRDEDPFEVNFKRIIAHPNYKCEQVNDDIALIELSEKLIFSKNVKSIDLRGQNENYSNTVATVAGWGWTDEDQLKGVRSDILQKATVKIWSNEECQDSYKHNGKRNIILPTQMCAGYKEGGIDSCWTDSGGPLMDNKEGTLIGVVSTGVGCARPGLPGIYTRISEYIEWIFSNIERPH